MATTWSRSVFSYSRSALTQVLTFSTSQNSWALKVISCIWQLRRQRHSKIKQLVQGYAETVGVKTRFLHIDLNHKAFLHLLWLSFKIFRMLSETLWNWLICLTMSVMQICPVPHVSLKFEPVTWQQKDFASDPYKALMASFFPPPCCSILGPPEIMYLSVANHRTSGCCFVLDGF